MRHDVLSQVIPNVDPDFVRIIEKLPDPPPNAFERAMQVMPELHALFLQKREAARRGDEAEFDRIVQREVELIERSIVK